MTRLYFWGEVDKGQSGLWNILSDTFYLDTFVESLVFLSEASGVSVENESGNNAKSWKCQRIILLS